MQPGCVMWVWCEDLCGINGADCAQNKAMVKSRDTTRLALAAASQTHSGLVFELIAGSLYVQNIEAFSNVFYSYI